MKNKIRACCGALMIFVMLGACGAKDGSAEVLEQGGNNLSNEVGTETAMTAAEGAGDIAIDGNKPVINSLKHKMIFVQDPASIDTNDIVDYTDDGQCTVMIWGYNKEEDVRKLPEDVVSSLSEALLSRYDEKALLSRTSKDIPTEEGIYTAVCTVSDASGNSAHTPVVVVIDKTPADVNDLDQMKQTVSSQEELYGRLQNIHVVDNVDGDIPIDKVGHEIVMGQGGSSYELVVSYTDKAGNTMEKSVPLSVTGGFEITGNTNETGTADVEAASTGSNNAGESEAGAVNAVQIPAGAGYRNDLSDQVLSLINEKRAKAGLSPLTMDQYALQAAGVRAVELVSSFSHNRPDGSSCYTALDQTGASYTSAGENIAAGQSTAESVVNSWMNSAGHRDNILNSNYTAVGIACYYDPESTYGYYWVQIFVG